MKNLVVIIIGILWTSGLMAGGPDTLTLDQCLELASERNPLARQKQLSDDILNERLRNLKSNWFPVVGFNAQALYNSETVDFSELLQQLPVDIPSLPLDQYKVWAEINQQIFDGGLNRAMKEIEKAGNLADNYQTEAELHSLRAQVSQVFFSLLLTRNSSEIIESSLGLLNSRKNKIKSGVENGVILPENILALEAEEISLQQKLTELNYVKSQLFRVLSILTDSVIPGNSVLVVPTVESDQNGARPEFGLFNQQIEKLQLNQKLLKSADMPKIFAFSQLAWGRPGYNMVSSDFHTFYTIGAGLKWNFLNYGDTKRQQKINYSQQQLIDVKRENFNDQLQIQLQSELTNIEKYDSMIRQDMRILELRKKIAEVSLSKLNNGIITSTDYLTDMNAELQTELQLENHKILRKQAEYNYLLIQGKLKY